MKRYDVIGEPTFDFIESISGDVIFYDEFNNLILARIKELEASKRETVFDTIIIESKLVELKNLLK